MDSRILIGLVAALLLFTAAPVSADDDAASQRDACRLGHDYGDCEVTVAGFSVTICFYSPDGCPGWNLT